MIDGQKISVVIPAYRVRDQILDVIAQIQVSVDKIYVIDDYCPEMTGKYVEETCRDSRVEVIYNGSNLGVGGAVKAGYKASLNGGMDIAVKIDGDGQMNPAILTDFIAPIINGEADYSKGNRFYDLEHLNRMPKLRLFGNSVLSFMNKISSGYWNIFDPTNGYTAIHTKLIEKISFDSVSNRYFFESDMLFRLNILKAVVVDIPMSAKYGDEKSSLKIYKITTEFLYKHTVNFFKRIFYNYYLRDMSLASFELPIGIAGLTFGVVYGVENWYRYSNQSLSTPVGTVMISVVSILFGLQLILAFLAYDITSVPRRIIHRTKLSSRKQFD
jgi:dolichol-phosphate mannosyltransferase